MAGAEDQLDGPPEQVLPDAADQRRLGCRRDRRLRLQRGVLPAHLLALVIEHGGQPLGVEHVHERVDQRPLLERANELAGAAHGDVPRPGHVDDGIERPVGHHDAAAPGGRQPGRARMGEPPDAQLSIEGVDADQRRLEWRRRAELAQLVGRRGARVIEDEAQNTLVGRAAGGSASGDMMSRRNRVGRASSEVIEAWKAIDRASQRSSWEIVSVRPSGQCSRT